MSGLYASDTAVPADRSRNEIERTLGRYGADQFLYGTTTGAAVIGFRMKGRNIRMTLPMPKVEDFLRTPKGQRRTQAAAQREWEQSIRQRWRALSLAVKAKLEAVASGIATFEIEFMPYTMLPDGKTVAQWMEPQIEAAYRSGKMPPLLPAPGETHA